MIWLFAIFQAAAIAVSVSIDALAVSFAYGTKKIKIPLLSLAIITLVCTGVIAVSFLLGSVLVHYLPETFLTFMSFAILFTIGLVKLFDSITKSIIRRYTQINKEIKLSVFNFKLVLHLYADPEAADADTSKCISAKEAVVLATSLSLDGFAVGIGAAIIGVNGWALVVFTLFSGFFALLLGGWLGKTAAEKLRFNISWLAGVILICLSVVQLV